MAAIQGVSQGTKDSFRKRRNFDRVRAHRGPGGGGDRRFGPRGRGDAPRPLQPNRQPAVLVNTTRSSPTGSDERATPSPMWRTDMVKFLRNEEGVTAIEYGLIAALIAVVIIGAVTALGTG